MDLGASVEEAKILKLTERLNSTLSSLRNKLEASFENLPQPPTAEESPKTAHANVLDDIAGNLHQSLGSVELLEAFVVDKIIRKIH